MWDGKVWVGNVESVVRYICMEIKDIHIYWILKMKAIFVVIISEGEVHGKSWWKNLIIVFNILSLKSNTYFLRLEGEGGMSRHKTMALSFYVWIPSILHSSWGRNFPSLFIEWTIWSSITLPTDIPTSSFLTPHGLLLSALLTRKQGIFLNLKEKAVGVISHCVATQPASPV